MTLSSFEHAFKAFVHDLVVGAKKVESVAASILSNPKVVEAETAANAVLAEVSPAAAKATEAAESLLAKAASAIMAAGDAAAAGGVNVTLDSTAVADIKAVIAAAKAGSAAVASPAPAPAAPAAPAA